jgi:hypothetical protein
MIALIAEAVGVIDMKGCFEGRLRGSGNQLKHKNDLMRIAAEFGLNQEVIAKNPSALLAFGLPDNELFVWAGVQGCLPGNSFQPNHYFRLNAISPGAINPFTFNTQMNYDSTLRHKGLVYMNQLAIDTHKPSFIMEALVFNPDMDSIAKQLLTTTHCNAMKAKLEKAPCCGPCVHCDARPSFLLEIDNSNGNVTGIKKELYDLDWFSDDSNANTFPCDRKRHKDIIYEKGETYFNGIDFLQDYLLWKMACGSGNEDQLPKLIQPNELKQKSGCENVGKVHIKGPNEVCKGDTVNFNISTGAIHTPTDGNPAWSINNEVKKNSLTYESLPNPKPLFQNYLNSSSFVFPNSTGTQTLSYQFNIAGQTKTITKTVTIVDVPDAPSVSDMKMNQENCTFTLEFTNQNNCSFVSTAGVNTGNSITFPMSTEPTTVIIYAHNSCGYSEPYSFDIPATPTPCNHEPRIVKNNTLGINPDEIAIFSNPMTKSISIRCDVFYNVPFDTKLYTMTGQLVDSQQFNSIDINIDYSNKDLQSGLYFFTLSTGGRFIKSAKFFLQNY